MRKTIPIQEVEPDVNPNETVGLFNPLDVDFTVLFSGKPFTILAGEKKIWPKPVAYHVGYHLADKIVRGQLNDFLQKKFPGLDDSGREKWRNQIQFASTRAEIEKVRDAILIDTERFISGTEKEVEVPAVTPVEEPKDDVLPAESVDEKPSADNIVEQIKERKVKGKGKK